MIWLATAFAATQAIEGTDIVVDVGAGDRFIPADEVASAMLEPGVVGVYVPVGSAGNEVVAVRWFPIGSTAAGPFDADALLAELRERQPSLRSWVEPPVWDAGHGTLSWALDTPVAVVGYVARPGRSGVVVVERSCPPEQWVASRTGLREVADRVGFGSGAALADAGTDEAVNGLDGLVLAVVAPEAPGSWWSSRHARRLLLMGLALFVVPVLIEWGRRRGTSWGRRLDPEHVPDVD